jgi:hypothetical protein
MDMSLMKRIKSTFGRIEDNTASGSRKIRMAMKYTF